MTDDLIARLRSVDVSWSETGEWCAEAADRIEALNAEVARLRTALRFYAAWGVFAPFHDDAVRDDGGDIARAALEGTSDE